MQSDRELMQQALHVLECYRHMVGSTEGDDSLIDALRERLAQYDALDRLAQIDRDLGI
jgi:hypothetical protein